MDNFDLRKYLAENKLLKEEIMVDTAVMVDPNNTLMSNASDEEIDYIKANITNVPKIPVEDFQERYDEYFDRFYGEGDPLDLQIKALQIHIDKGVLTREEAIEALAMLQGADVEDYEDEFLAEGRLLNEVKDLELKSLAKKLIPVIKKYKMPVEYITSSIEFNAKPKEGGNAVPARLFIKDGILTVSVYFLSLAASINELDMGSGPSEETYKNAKTQAAKMYKDIVAVIGDEFELISNKEENEYGFYLMKIRKKGQTNEGKLNESAPGYDTRKFGESLPTMESVKAAYEAKKEKEEEPRDGVKSAAAKLGIKPNHIKEEDITETRDLSVKEKMDNILYVMDPVQVIDELILAMSTDDANLYLDAIIQDHGIMMIDEEKKGEEDEM